jgi:RecA/RadA recombinase
MSKQKLRLAVHTHSPGYGLPGKHFWLDGGQLTKGVNGQTIEAKVEVREYHTLDELAAELRQMTPNQYLTAGIPNVGEGICVSSSRKAAMYAAGSEKPGTHNGMVVVTRTKDDLPFPDGPGLMLVDNDGEYDLDAVLRKAQPELLEHKFLDKASSGSCIFDDEGNELKPRKGGHRFWHVKTATDIPQALHALSARCIIAGFDESRIGEAGQFLIRSPVDEAMQVSCQPIFIRAHCGKGLHQRMDITVSDGIEILDTVKVIPPLTDEEQAQYCQKVAESMARLKPQASKARKRFYERQVKILTDKDVPNSRAQQTILEAMTGRVLPADFVVTLASGKQVSVLDILSDKKRYHGMNCRDPLEPSYGSRSVAIIYTDKAPMIRSMAHGLGSMYGLSAVTSLACADDMDDYAKERLSRLDDAYAASIERQRQGDPVDSLAEVIPEDSPGLVTALMRHHLTYEEASNFKEDECLYRRLIPEGRVVALVGPPGAGKTTLLQHLCGEFDAEVFYIHMDGSPSDMKHAARMAHEGGYSLIAPDYKGCGTAKNIYDELDLASRREQSLAGMVFIIDTLKKLYEVNSKRDAKEMFGIFRRLSAKGATIILLGHTTKYRDRDGWWVYEGTSDIKADSDCLLLIDRYHLNEESIVVSLYGEHQGWEHAKHRFMFKPESFLMDMSDDRKIIRQPDWVDTHKMYVDKSTEHREADAIVLIHHFLGQQSEGASQKRIVEAVQSQGVSRRKTRQLLKQFQDKFWKASKGAVNNAIIYSQIPVSNIGKASEVAMLNGIATKNGSCNWEPEDDDYETLD